MASRPLRTLKHSSHIPPRHRKRTSPCATRKFASERLRKRKERSTRPKTMATPRRRSSALIPSLRDPQNDSTEAGACPFLHALAVGTHQAERIRALRRLSQQGRRPTVSLSANNSQPESRISGCLASAGTYYQSVEDILETHCQGVAL